MNNFNEQESELLRRLQDSSFDDAPRPEHLNALRDQVMQAFDQANAQSSVNSRSHNKHFWRDFMHRPIPRTIAASIVCLSIAAPWLFFPAHQTKAFAFNNLAAAIVDAKTAKFQMEITIEGPVGALKDGLPAQKCQSYYLAPGKYRAEMALGEIKTVSICDEVTGKMVMLTPSTKMAAVTTSKGKPDAAAANDPFSRLRSLLSKDRNSEKSPFHSIGEKKIDGKTAIGFRSKSAWEECTLWGDPTTGLPIRVEAVWGSSPRSSVVMSDFEIDVKLDESLFDMTIPPDYKVQSLEVDVSETTEADLIKAFTKCGEVSDGQFPDTISGMDAVLFYFNHAKGKHKNLFKGQDAKVTPTQDELNQMTDLMTKEFVPIQRGFRFASDLPESAEATYAGKGAKQGTKDRPIFWYKPEGAKAFRVIYADLSVKDADKSPEIADAVRLKKKPNASDPAEK